MDLVKFVDYLRRSEILFEVVIRGGNCDTVRAMRSELRSLLQAKTEPDISVIKDDKLVEQLQLARDSLEDLSEDVLIK